MKAPRLALLGVLALTSAVAAEPTLPDARALAAAAEAGLRAQGAWLEGTLWPRGRRGRRPESLAFRAWLDGVAGRGRLQLTAPEREAGRTWLYLPPVLWGVEPGGEAPRRLPDDALREGWMGGQIALLDLLVGLGNVDDWRHRLVGEEPEAGAAEAGRVYLLESWPRDAVPEGGARVRQWVDVDGMRLLRREHLDATGRVLRRIEFEDHREVGGRPVAHRWVVTRPGAGEPESVVELRKVEPRADFDPAVFASETLLARPSPPRE